MFSVAFDISPGYAYLYVSVGYGMADEQLPVAKSKGPG